VGDLTRLITAVLSDHGDEEGRDDRAGHHNEYRDLRSDALRGRQGGRHLAADRAQPVHCIAFRVGRRGGVPMAAG
jgi:hypothetical protein